MKKAIRKSQTTSRRSVVTCDFTELDEIRKDVRLLVDEIPNNPYRKTTHRGRRSSYDYSRFYVGRGVTALRFTRLHVSEFQINRVRLRLRRLHPHCEIHTKGRNLTVYVRGKKRK